MSATIELPTPPSTSSDAKLSTSSDANNNETIIKLNEQEVNVDDLETIIQEKDAKEMSQVINKLITNVPELKKIIQEKDATKFKQAIKELIPNMLENTSVFFLVLTIYHDITNKFFNQEDKNLADGLVNQALLSGLIQPAIYTYENLLTPTVIWMYFKLKGKNQVVPENDVPAQKTKQVTYNKAALNFTINEFKKMQKKTDQVHEKAQTWLSDYIKLLTEAKESNIVTQNGEVILTKLIEVLELFSIEFALNMLSDIFSDKKFEYNALNSVLVSLPMPLFKILSTAVKNNYPIIAQEIIGMIPRSNEESLDQNNNPQDLETIIKNFFNPKNLAELFVQFSARSIVRSVAESIIYLTEFANNASNAARSTLGIVGAKAGGFVLDLWYKKKQGEKATENNKEKLIGTKEQKKSQKIQSNIEEFIQQMEKSKDQMLKLINEKTDKQYNQLIELIKQFNSNTETTKNSKDDLSILLLTNQITYLVGHQKYILEKEIPSLIEDLKTEKKNFDQKTRREQTSKGKEITALFNQIIENASQLGPEFVKIFLENKQVENTNPTVVNIENLDEISNTNPTVVNIENLDEISNTNSTCVPNINEPLNMGGTLQPMNPSETNLKINTSTIGVKINIKQC